LSTSYCLSKSKYLNGLQCPKLLWMSYHAKDQFPPTDPATQAIFDQGNEVTTLAQTLFPGGIEIKGVEDIEAILKKTQELLPQRKPLFEAALSFKNSLARADILVPNKDGSWDLYEVKSSTQVKDIHYEDVAFQKYCYEGAGLKIRKVYLVHINNQYVKNGPIDPAGLLHQEDVTEQAEKLAAQVEERVNEMVRILNQKECPKVAIGPQCSNPYDCSLQDLCWQHIPEDSVFILNRIRSDKAFAFINEGFLRAQDVPIDRLKAATHHIVHRCHSENKIHVDPAAIQAFIAKLQFPIHFIDFETVSPAVPLYDGTRPFQQVPFQFSLHILHGPGEKLEHHAFLAEGTKDPRPEFLKRLKALIGPKGSIVAYNLDFERRCLAESVSAYSEFEDWFTAIEGRLLDLMGPFQKFDYYDPKQLGKYSIKSVYPALIGGSYKEMAISEGGQASREYARVTFADDITEEDRRRIYEGLLEYCKLDTKAMVDILNVLSATHQTTRPFHD